MNCGDEWLVWSIGFGLIILSLVVLSAINLMDRHLSLHEEEDQS